MLIVSATVCTARDSYKVRRKAGELCYRRNANVTLKYKSVHIKLRCVAAAKNKILTNQNPGGAEKRRYGLKLAVEVIGSAQSYGTGTEKSDLCFSGEISASFSAESFPSRLFN